MELETLIKNLNAKTASERLSALSQIMELYKNGTLPYPKTVESVNNHIHTTYSFSPYSPTKAVYMAFCAGLKTAGIMDHDSIAGAKEFIKAGEIAGISTTVGLEVRVKMNGSKFFDRRYNNPDQPSVAYVACHGVPHQNIDKMQEFMTPYRAKRNERDKKEVEKINELIKDSGVTLDFEKDVLPISEYQNGGSVTERHILYALSLKLIEKLGKGEPLVDFLQNKLNISLPQKVIDNLLNIEKEYYEYTLLGALKSDLVPKFYINSEYDCPDVSEFVKAVADVGAISAYAYLGDVGESVTGDKKAQKFEDEFIDELVPELKKFGFAAITFMPTRNTEAQAQKIMRLADENDLFQICGEDVNSPSQSFVCAALEKPEFRHLISAAWALIGHEKAATQNIEDAFFSPKTVQKMPSLTERIAYFEKIGKAL